MAQMGILYCWHPEIETFIEAKRKGGSFKRFNLSVGITDEFMEAVEKDLDWDLVFPEIKHPEYKKSWRGNLELWTRLGLPVRKYKTVKARDLWEKIMTNTYNFNDPGVFFVSTANKLNSINYAENIHATNP